MGSTTKKKNCAVLGIAYTCILRQLLNWHAQYFSIHSVVSFFVWYIYTQHDYTTRNLDPHGVDSKSWKWSTTKAIEENEVNASHAIAVAAQTLNLFWIY